jgi:hypothetical protein
MPAEPGTGAPRRAALALLALPTTAPAVAGPPEGVSSGMVFDKATDGLRKYEKETDKDKRLLLLLPLAKTQDPRVAVALGEAFTGEEGVFAEVPALLLLHNYVDPGLSYGGDSKKWLKGARAWWADNSVGLRRRAKELPRWPPGPQPGAMPCPPTRPPTPKRCPPSAAP